MGAPQASRSFEDTPFILRVPEQLGHEIEQAALNQAVDVPHLLTDALQSYRAERRRLLLAQLRPDVLSEHCGDEQIEAFVDEVRAESYLARRR